MTRYSPLWQQGNAYPAGLDRSLFSALWPNGGGLLGAVLAAVANTMNVNIPPGTIAVPLQAGQGVALCTWDAAEVVTLGGSPPSGQTRIDLVVAQVRDNAIDGGPNNDFLFQVVPGVPAATAPAVPATPANALAIGQVTVPGAAANLNGATVTDLRPYGTRPAGRCFYTAQGGLVQGWNQVGGGATAAWLVNGMTFSPTGPFGFIVPRPGMYLACGNIVVGNINNAGVLLAAPFVNGNRVGQGSAGINPLGAAGGAYAGFAEVMACNAGDKITAGMYWNGGGSAPAMSAGNINQNCLSAVLIA